jgi:hypothetical protein
VGPAQADKKFHLIRQFVSENVLGNVVFKLDTLANLENIRTTMPTGVKVMVVFIRHPDSLHQKLTMSP